MPVADDYGAALAGVRDLLPHRRIAADTKPSEDAVAGFLDAAVARVRARIGDITGAGDEDALEAAARVIVHHFAAAMAEDAAFPERASVADSDYGTVLWQRGNELLAELLTVIAAGGAADLDDPAGDGAAYFPPALWSRATGF